MAESGGFEPPVQLSPYNGLANRRLQPLGQLSGDVAGWDSLIITEGFVDFPLPPPPEVSKVLKTENLSLDLGMRLLQGVCSGARRITGADDLRGEALHLLCLGAGLEENEVNPDGGELG